MTTLHFESIAPIENLAQYRSYQNQLQACSQITSDYSFANIWGWADEYELTWARYHELVWIAQQKPVPTYWAPVGDWSKVDWPSCFEQVFPMGAQFVRVPEKLADLWKSALPNQIKIEEARGEWDYLYATKELAELRGNRFHKKKNLLRQFQKKYDFTYVPMAPALVEDALSMQTDWCLWKDCESSDTLTSENRAIERILTHWASFENLLGGGIISDGKLIAYTIAEPLSEDMLVIHFEKGNQDYKGIYQAINQMFMATITDSFTTVNREQDLDDPGLRKAKLSYNPIGFQKKYKLRYMP